MNGTISRDSFSLGLIAIACSLLIQASCAPIQERSSNRAAAQASCVQLPFSPISPDHRPKRHLLCLGEKLTIDRPIYSNGGDVIVLVDTLEISAPIDTRVYYPLNIKPTTDASYISWVEDYFYWSADVWCEEENAYCVSKIEPNGLLPEPQFQHAIEPHPRITRDSIFRLLPSLPQPSCTRQGLDSGDITIVANEVVFCEECARNDNSSPISELSQAARGEVSERTLFQASALRPARGSLNIPRCTGSSPRFCAHGQYKGYALNDNSYGCLFSGEPGKAQIYLTGADPTVRRGSGRLANPEKELSARLRSGYTPNYVDAVSMPDMQSSTCAPDGRKPISCLEKLPRFAEIVRSSEPPAIEVGSSVDVAVNAIAESLTQIDTENWDSRELVSILAQSGVEHSWSPSGLLTLYLQEAYWDSLSNVVDAARKLPQEIKMDPRPSVLQGSDPYRFNSLALSPAQRRLLREIRSHFDQRTSEGIVSSYLSNSGGLIRMATSTPERSLQFQAAQDLRGEMIEELRDIQVKLIDIEKSVFEFWAETKLQEAEGALSEAVARLQQAEREAQKAGLLDLIEPIGALINGSRGFYDKLKGCRDSDCDYKGTGRALRDLFSYARDLMGLLEGRDVPPALYEAVRQARENLALLREQIEQRRVALLEEQVTEMESIRDFSDRYATLYIQVARGSIAQTVFRQAMLLWHNDNSGNSRDSFLSNLDAVQSLLHDYPVLVDTSAWQEWNDQCKGDDSRALCDVLTSEFETLGCTRFPPSGARPYSVRLKDESWNAKLGDLPLITVDASQPSINNLHGVVFGAQAEIAGHQKVCPPSVNVANYLRRLRRAAATYSFSDLGLPDHFELVSGGATGGAYAYSKSSQNYHVIELNRSGEPNVTGPYSIADNLVALQGGDGALVLQGPCQYSSSGTACEFAVYFKDQSEQWRGQRQISSERADILVARAIGGHIWVLSRDRGSKDVQLSSIDIWTSDIVSYGTIDSTSWCDNGRLYLGVVGGRFGVGCSELQGAGAIQLIGGELLVADPLFSESNDQTYFLDQWYGYKRGADPVVVGNRAARGRGSVFTYTIDNLGRVRQQRERDLKGFAPDIDPESSLLLISPDHLSNTRLLAQVSIPGTEERRVFILDEALTPIFELEMIANRRFEASLIRNPLAGIPFAVLSHPEERKLEVFSLQ